MSNIEISWESEIKNKSDLFISKMPVFHRRIAEELITEGAIGNAKNENLI